MRKMDSDNNELRNELARLSQDNEDLRRRQAELGEVNRKLSEFKLENINGKEQTEQSH